MRERIFILKGPKKRKKMKKKIIRTTMILKQLNPQEENKSKTRPENYKLG